MNDVVTAVIYVVPGTLAALAAWRSAAKGGRTSASINRAVSLPGPGETLVAKVDSMGDTIDHIADNMDGIKARVGTLERKVG